MKVLLINTVYEIGSTGKICFNLYNDLKIENEPYVIYGRGDENIDKNIYKCSSQLGLLFHVFMTRLFDKHGFYSKQDTIKIIKLIKNINPDIIHIHNIHGYYMNFPLFLEFLSSCDCPIIWTLHDCWNFTGHSAYFDEKSDRKFLSDYPSSLVDNSKKNLTIKEHYFSQLKNVTFVSPSNWLKNIAKQTFLNKNEIITIPNGIDLKSYFPTDKKFKYSNNLSDKVILLGISSKWEYRKGYSYFLELADELSHDRYQIVLVGEIKGEKHQKIMYIKNVKDHAILSDLYSSAGVYINPTLNDNFPTTNLEALACGTPVITFNTGGSPESLNDKCGIIIKNKNIQELKDAILEEHYLKMLSEDCISQASLYSNKKMTSDYLKLYKKKYEI